MVTIIILPLVAIILSSNSSGAVIYVFINSCGSQNSVMSISVVICLDSVLVGYAIESGVFISRRA